MKFLHLSRLALAALVLVSPSLFAETVWLSSLDLKQMTCGWGDAKADHSILGKPLSLGGKQFLHGVGTHAPSNFRVNLGGSAKRFLAQVGVDDGTGTHGSMEFIVSGDGKVLWKSGVKKGGQPATSVDVDVTGVLTLALRVTDGGDGNSYDHADWADAQIVMSENATAPVALPPYEKFSVATEHFA